MRIVTQPIKEAGYEGYAWGCDNCNTVCDEYDCVYLTGYSYIMWRFCRKCSVVFQKLLNDHLK